MTVGATHATIEDDIASYGAAVRDALSDLPAPTREEITQDLDAHLGEVAHEGGIPLSTRLGPPGQYAAELRRSAGLPPPAAPTQPRGPGLARRLLTCAADDMGHIAPLLRPALRPGWWLLRGALAAVLATIASAGLLVAAFGVAGLVVAFVLFVVLAVTGPVTSVMLGRRAHLGTSPTAQALSALATMLVATATVLALLVLAKIIVLG